MGKKPEIHTARVNDKMLVMNGTDPLRYVDLTNVHRKWWQIWKRRIRSYPKIRYAIYYKFKPTKPQSGSKGASK